MLFINATLYKNQIYKHKNQINKHPTISKYDNKILFQLFLHVCHLISCYHNGGILICRFRGVTLKKIVKLLWEFSINFLPTIGTRLWLLALLKVNLYSSSVKRNKYLWDGCFSILLLSKSVPRKLKICIKISLAEIF